MSLRNKAVAGVRWTTLNSISITIIQFIRLAILGRLLTPSIFGLMAMLMIVIEITNIFSQLGLSEAIIFKKHTSANQLSTLYWINVASGVIFYLILLLSSPAIATFFGEAILEKMLVVVALNFIVSSFSIQFQTLIRKDLLFSINTKINIATNLITMFVAVGLALRGYGVWSIIYSQLLLNILKTIAYLYIARQKDWLPRLYFNFSEIRDHISFGMHRVGAMIANQFSSRIDQIVIGRLLGQVSLGYYNIAFRIVLEPIQKINPILTQVAFPVFSVIQDDNVRLQRGYLKMIRLLMSINAPLLVGIASVAPTAVPLLLGRQWIPSIPIVQVLSFYALFRSLGNAGGSLIIAKGKASWTLYWNLVLMILIPSCVILAVKINGSMLVVSMTLVLLQVVLVILHYFVFLRRLIGSFTYKYMLAIGQPLFVSIIMGGIVYSLQAVLSQFNPIIILLTSIIVGLIIYIILSMIVQRSVFIEFWEILPLGLQRKFHKSRIRKKG
jgi:O-antigen/teichoic acid export membrane protein